MALPRDFEHPVASFDFNVSDWEGEGHTCEFFRRIVLMFRPTPQSFIRSPASCGLTSKTTRHSTWWHGMESRLNAPNWSPFFSANVQLTQCTYQLCSIQILHGEVHQRRHGRPRPGRPDALHRPDCQIETFPDLAHGLPSIHSKVECHEQHVSSAGTS